MLDQYKNKNIHIIGIGGAEGSAIAEFLVMHGITSVTGHDFSPKDDFGKAFRNTHLSLKSKERENALDHLLNLPIKINFKEDYLAGAENADIVFVSQVWFKYPQNLPKLKDLYDKGIMFKTITNLYFELAPCKIISVTGTNGKTTTSRLINSIFEVWGRGNENPEVYFAGNDRQNIQVLDKLAKMEKEDVLILETSSTQLMLNSGISPYIGVITNITPNHIDDHGSLENYIEAKKNLIRFQKKGDFAVLNYDDVYSQKFIKSVKSKVFLFSRKKKLESGCFVSDGRILAKINGKETQLLSLSDIRIPGMHNVENVLAAASAAYLYGVDPEIIREGISKYSGIKHRLKLLYNIKGVRYYDDTQATTPEATISGLDSFEGDIILLAGGDDKGMNYDALSEKICKKAKFLILFPGDASNKIEALLDGNNIEFAKVIDMNGAIDQLKKYYQKTAMKDGSVVLISPASAHFYSKFVENSGKDLKEWIRLVSSI
ncbi:MAG: UDP-N-acetylmuramoyl-L-alanine--D-glutamate ligase [Candidatus Paceibacterota bacterium]|jgi:UDP-N-acetylmuramoylalanine--D-glutamate ligase